MSTYPNIIATKDARIAELEAALHIATNDKLSLLDQLDREKQARMAQIDYGCDLQRIIEDLCRGGPIREPKTSARHHYNMAVEALSRTGAVKVKALEWEEITRARSNEDPSREVVGWEASEAVSASYYTVELTGGGASMTDPDYNEKHYDDPDVAKAAAQADFERRILSALEPAAPEGQQPVANEPATNHWPEAHEVADILAENKGFWRACSGCHETNEGHPTGPWSTILGCNLGNGCHECGGIGAVWDTTDYADMGDCLAQEFTRPSEQAVTDAMVEAVRKLILDDVDVWLSDDTIRGALKAAMEAGR